MKSDHAVLPFVMGGIAFLCFLAAVLLMSTAVQPLWGQTMVLLLPALILWGVGAAARRGSLSPRAAGVLTAVLSVVLLLLSVLWFFFLSFRSATTVTTNTKYYERAYDRIGVSARVKACFPPGIPPEARDVSFSYRPQFLQGGEVFLLSYSTTEEEIIERVGRLQAAAEWSGPDDEWFRMHDQGAGDSDLIRFQLYGSGFSNHGEECFGLIDRSNRRITYYYSKW